MEMFKVGDEVELDLTSDMFADPFGGTTEDELNFCKDFGLIPDKVYTVTEVAIDRDWDDEEDKYFLICLDGVRLSWCPSRFKHAVTTLENE